MKEIKKLNHLDLTEKFGLNIESKDFIFKSPEAIPNLDTEPHRSELYSIGIVLNGTAVLKVGLDCYNVQAPGLLTVGADQIMQWVCAQNLSTVVLFFTEDFIVSGLSDALFVKKLGLYKNTGNHFVPLKPEEATALKMLFDQIEKKNASNSSIKNVIIQALTRILLLEAESLQQAQPVTGTDKYSQAHQITYKFKELLSVHFTKQREVSYYAESLCVTPKYLSQMLKEYTGKTAGELIDEIVCLEAKVLLQLNELNIAEIADKLNFANPSFFGKFFKRHTGTTPVEYRKSLS